MGFTLSHKYLASDKEYINESIESYNVLLNYSELLTHVTGIVFAECKFIMQELHS